MAEIPPVRPREPAWRSLRTNRSPALWNKSIDTHCDRPAAVRIRKRRFADAVMTEIAAPPVTVTQDNSAGDSPHRFHMVHLLAGHGTYYWANGTACQRAGDIVLIDTAEPSQVVSPTDSKLLRWSFPEALIAPFLPACRFGSVLHLPADGALVQVIAKHTKQLSRATDRLDRTVQQGLLVHLCGLLALAVETEVAPGPISRSSYRSVQRHRVLCYIETHLRDPRCTAKRAANDLGMSVRWLHALLEDMEESFCNLVARRRVEISLGFLQDAASADLSITEIAFLSGFNDLSTFYRRFGEYYGMPPGAVRRRRSLLVNDPLLAGEPGPSGGRLSEVR